MYSQNIQIQTTLLLFIGIKYTEYIALGRQLLYSFWHIVKKRNNTLSHFQLKIVSDYDHSESPKERPQQKEVLQSTTFRSYQLIKLEADHDFK